MESDSLKERKIAIVTGAAGNLGQAVVKKFIDENFFVAGTITQHDIAANEFSADKYETTMVDLRDEK